MRVKQITVNKLFGMFNHTIPLNQEERITIIHGPNGFGKTSILRLIDGLLGSNSSALRAIPFENFQLLFDDLQELEVSKAIEDYRHSEREEINGNKVSIRHSGHKEPYILPSMQDWDKHFPLSAIEEYLPVRRVGQSRWITYETAEELSINELIDRYGEMLPFRGIGERKEPKWLLKLKESLSVRLIQTQRLFTLGGNRSRKLRHETVLPMVSVVTEYSKELADTIKVKLGEYATLSQSLDRSFPTRLLDEQHSKPLSDEELRDKLTNLEEKRASLTKVGLLDPAQDADFRTQPISEINERNKSVLAVYVEDVERKLGVFNELAIKIEFFKTIVNERFLYKRMDIDKNGGISFTTNDGYLLSPNNLSSGEQHELVLFYNLLFKVTPNSLILIDEPEISLHVSWQEQFLRDIQKVAQLSEFDVLLATHSPEIIADKWDLTVALEKPQKLPGNNSNGKQKRQRQSAVTVR